MKKALLAVGLCLALAVLLFLPLSNRSKRNAVQKRKVVDLTALQMAAPDFHEGDPGEAASFFLQKRLPDGVTALDPTWYRNAINQASGNAVYSSAQGGLSTNALATWTPLGPGNVGGRTRNFLVDPTNPNVMYAAGVAGGVWKSTNAGGTWAQLTDLGIPNLAINSLIMDPQNPNVLYAGTGEGYFNIDSLRGAGIFKTADGGASWTQLASTANSDFFYVNKLAVSPNAPARIYAATETGLFRSLDGGASFAKVLDAASVNGCFDVKTQSNRALLYVVAACGSFANNGTEGIYRAIDNNNTQTWTKVFSVPNMGRTSLAIAPSNPSVIYAMSASNAPGSLQYGLLGVFRSTNNGASGTWTTQLDGSGALPPETSPAYQNRLLLTNPVFAYAACVGAGSKGFFNQGWYDNALAVDPVDPNKVYAGGIDLFRSDDGGQNWGIMSYWYYPTSGLFSVNYVHADQHAITFHPQFDGSGNQTMLIGNDGGLFKTLNAHAATLSGFPDGDGVTPAACSNATPSVSWGNLNNSYAVTQFYHGLPYPDGTRLFGGTQDNGTPRGSVGAPNAWSVIAGGDGGYVAVDPTNTNVIFHEFTGLSLQKSINGNNAAPTWTNAVSGISDAFPFITTFRMDPGNPQNMWISGTKMWRSTNQATSWTSATVALTSGSILAIGINPSNSNLLLAGTASGRIARTSTALTDVNASWPFVAPNGTNNGAISWLEWQPGSSSVAYVTYSTFGVTAHIWKTTDGGATWSPLDGTAPNRIPDIPVHCIVVDPTNSSRLYVGTDIGVFTSIDGGVNWLKENTGFANVIVQTMAFDSANRLYAFTHGRGAWRVNLVP